MQLLERVDAVLGQQHQVAFALEQALHLAAHGQRIVDHHHTCARRGQRHAAFAGRRRVLRQQFRVVGQVLRQRHRIQYQHDVAGAQHGRAGDARHARQLRAHMLDHHFAVAQHIVDLQRQSVVAIA